jgi:hypothetical protein
MELFQRESAATLNSNNGPQCLFVAGKQSEQKLDIMPSMFIWKADVSWTPGLPDFSWHNIPKRRNIYQITIKYTKRPQSIPNNHKIVQMDIICTNIFYCKTLQNLPKLGFLVWKYAIWQPCWTPRWKTNKCVSLLLAETDDNWRHLFGKKVESSRVTRWAC